MAKQTNLLSDLTGLPEKAWKDAGHDNHENDILFNLTGVPSKAFSPVPDVKNFTVDPLSNARKTIDLTNTYTEPLANYEKYNVPLNPFADWNDIRAQNQGTLEKWAHGVTKAGITAVGAVAENTVGVLGGLLNMAFGENHSYYDNPVGQSIDSINQWAQEALPNYYTQEEQNMGVLESMGTANFWADKFANGAGYTLGSLATMWTGAGEGALISKLGSLGKYGKLARAGEEALALGDKAIDAARAGSSQFRSYNLSKTLQAPYTKEFLKDIDKGLAVAGKKALIKTQAKQLSVGIHMSLAESSVEAREAKNGFIREQKEKWEKENPGEPMPADVENAMMESAAAVGNLTFGVNLPLLTLTNIWSFGKMMKTGKVEAEGVMNGIKKSGEKWVEDIPTSGMGKAFAKANRIFGVPIKDAVSEGSQEAGQFITASAADEYYTDKFADGVGDMSSAFVHAMSKSIGTKEGLESILIGALVGGGSGTISRLSGADSKFAKQKDANTVKALEILNSGAFTKVLENMESSEKNIKLVNSIKTATDAGEYNKADRLRKRLISNVADSYRKVGALDYAMEQLEDLKALDETEFKARWGYAANESLQKQTGKTQAELVDDVKSTIEKSVKRQEQVDNILRAQKPSTGMFAKILDSFQTDEIRNSKALESTLRTMYGNMLVHRAVDIDSIDEMIKDQYHKLLAMAPSLKDVSPEDFEYHVKTGSIEMDDKGNMSVTNKTTNTPADKTLAKLREVFASKFALQPLDAAEFKKATIELADLVRDRQSAIQSYEGLVSSPEKMALMVEAEVEKQKKDSKYQAAQQATASIQNSQTVDELNDTFPNNASPEDYAKAMLKKEELLKQENALVEGYEKLSDKEFADINVENLSPIEEAAYNRSVRKREERKADEAASKNIGFNPPSKDEVQDQEASYEEVLSDIEARTFGEIMVSPDGSSVIIEGRHYHNLEDNPADAIQRDETGEISGFTMTDISTGNKITWKRFDVETSENPERTEKENAIVEGLAYMTLLQMAAVRNDQSVPIAEAKEQLEPRIEAIVRDADTREKFEENNESTETERDLAKRNLSKTSALTDDQLRTQIEVLKQDLEEVNDILNIEQQIANEAGFTKKEFNQDPQTKELKRIKKRITELLNTKIKALRDRKQQAQDTVLQNVESEAKLEPTLSPSEEEGLIAGATAEIKDFEDQLSQIAKEAKAYQDIIDGKYENQDVASAAVALKALNRKMGVLKAQITKRKNLIDRVNETRELEKLRESSDTPEGAQQSAEGQEPEGKDITPRETLTPTGLDGTLSQEAVEKIRLQKEEAERLRKEEEERKRLAAAPPAPIVTTPAPVTIGSTGNDVRLAKGEVETMNNKVVVSTEGRTVSGDEVQQSVAGVPILVQPSVLTNPEVAKVDDVIEYEVREDTDWWKSQIPADKTDKEVEEWMMEEGWKTVPIYAVVTMPDGTKTKVALLQSQKDELAPGQQGNSRRDIVKLYKQGLTPVSKVSTKIWDSTNYSNARLADGTVYFYPASTMSKAGEIPAVVYVGVKGYEQEQKWKVATEGTTPITNLESIANASKTDKTVLGQIGIVTIDPSGNPTIVVASTRGITEEGRTAALNKITEGDMPNLSLFGQIVGTNLLLNESVNFDLNDLVDTELNEDIAREAAPGNLERFMLIETLANGTQLLTFWSPSANSLVRMSAANLKISLLGGKPIFSVVEVGKNDRGYDAILTVKVDDSVRSATENNLMAEFKDAIMKKKFQVDKDLLGRKEPFTSPLNPTVTYNSYFEYLTSENELTTDREEGVGTRAILAVDVATNDQNSAFNDVGLQMGNLGTREKNVKTDADLRAQQVAAPSDNTPAATSTSAIPAFTTLLKTKDSVNDTPVMKSKDSNFETLYVPRKVYELAYENDEINKTRQGGPQTLDRIIERGGYNIEEFNKLLPDWKKVVASINTEASKTQAAPSNEVVTVYHHTSVTPENFNFSSFKRGNKQISQFGDGLNAASTTTPFFVSRYGNPIKGEVKDSDFVVIDANMSQKEMYEMLTAKGFKFNNPQMGKATPKGGSYVGGSAVSEYDDTSPLKDSPGAALDLFNDFQASNPQVKGVKVINHVIGNENVDPFYVIYDSKSFYGPNTLSKTPATPSVPSTPGKQTAVETEVLSLLNLYAEPSNKEFEYQGDEDESDFFEKGEDNSTRGKLVKALNSLPPVAYNLRSKTVAEFKQKIQEEFGDMELDEMIEDINSIIDKLIAEKSGTPTKPSAPVAPSAETLGENQVIETKNFEEDSDIFALQAAMLEPTSQPAPVKSEPKVKAIPTAAFANLTDAEIAAMTGMTDLGASAALFASENIQVEGKDLQDIC